MSTREPPRAAVSSETGAPPPPRRERGAPDDRAAGGPNAATAAVVPGPVIVAPSARRPTPAVSGAGRRGRPEPTAAPGGRDSLPLVLRVLAWVVALPLSLAIVGLPARKLGYLSSQRLLDVFVESGTGRLVPLAVVVVLWGLVTAMLVTLLVEGGRHWMLRRRAAAAQDRRPNGSTRRGS